MRVYTWIILIAIASILAAIVISNCSTRSGNSQISKFVQARRQGWHARSGNILKQLQLEENIVDLLTRFNAEASPEDFVYVAEILCGEAIARKLTLSEHRHFLVQLISNGRLDERARLDVVACIARSNDINSLDALLDIAMLCGGDGTIEFQNSVMRYVSVVFLNIKKRHPSVETSDQCKKLKECIVSYRANSSRIEMTSKFLAMAALYSGCFSCDESQDFIEDMRAISEDSQSLVWRTVDEMFLIKCGDVK